jgi:hypothetical protein
MRRTILAGFLVVAVLAWGQGMHKRNNMQQEQGPNTVVEAPASVPLGYLPILPACAQAAPVHGDPGQGPTMLYARAGANCVIPWHWHTPNEQVIMVSGNAKLEMKEGGTRMLKPGSYAYLQSRHVHQFTCMTGCGLYIYSDTKFDLHYVDKSGNEIPPEQAYKVAGMKAPPAAGMEMDHSKKK